MSEEESQLLDEFWMKFSELCNAYIAKFEDENMAAEWLQERTSVYGRYTRMTP